MDFCALCVLRPDLARRGVAAGLRRWVLALGGDRASELVGRSVGRHVGLACGERVGDGLRAALRIGSAVAIGKSKVTDSGVGVRVEAVLVRQVLAHEDDVVAGLHDAAVNRELEAACAENKRSQRQSVEESVIGNVATLPSCTTSTS